MQFNDAVAGLAFLLLGIGLVATATTYPAMPGQPYGAALFPTIIGTAFGICGLLLVVRGLSAAGRRRPVVELDPLIRVPRNAISLLLLPGSVLLYILLADRIGFVPLAFVLLMGLFLWFRVRPLNALLIAGLFTAGTFWFFAYILRVPLPRGWLTGII